MLNQSTEPLTWQEDDLTFTEVIRQAYAGNNCAFSAGFVEGHSADTMYLRFEKDRPDGTRQAAFYLLRPDEMAAVAWLASGVLWSHQMAQDENHADLRNVNTRRHE